MEATALYSWSVAQPDDPAGWRAGGVSSSRDRAVLALCEALYDDPVGVRGTVWRISIALAGPVAYRYEGLVACARHDPATGRIACTYPAKRSGRSGSVTDRPGEAARIAERVRDRDFGPGDGS